MPMGKVDKNVNCPYYLKDEGIRLSCEGVKGATATNLVFPTKKLMMEYRRAHCIRCWKECPIAQALNKVWEYEV